MLVALSTALAEPLHDADALSGAQCAECNQEYHHAEGIWGEGHLVLGDRVKNTEAYWSACSGDLVSRLSPCQ